MSIILNTNLISVFQRYQSSTAGRSIATASLCKVQKLQQKECICLRSTQLLHIRRTIGTNLIKPPISLIHLIYNFHLQNFFSGSVKIFNSNKMFYQKFESEKTDRFVIGGSYHLKRAKNTDIFVSISTIKNYIHIFFCIYYILRIH